MQDRQRAVSGVIRCARLAAPLVIAILLASPALADAAPQWLEPVTLSAPTQSFGLQPKVAVDAHGDAFAIWSRGSAGETDVVESAERPAGGSWQTPVELSPPGQEGLEPQIAVDPQGDAVAIWQWRESSGCCSNAAVQATERPSGGTWRPPVQISGRALALGLSLAVDSRGDAVAVWDTDGVVQAAARSAQGGWQAPVNISLPGHATLEPEVAMDPGGEAMVVWEDGNLGDETVEGAMRPAGGGWQAPVNISREGVVAIHPHVSVDALGDAVAVWEAAVSAVVEGAARPAGGPWRSPVQVSPPGERAAFPQAAIDASGEATAMWYDETGQMGECGCGFIVRSAMLPSVTGSWQAPVSLTTPAGFNAGRVFLSDPQIAVDAQGDTAAVWDLSNGSNYIVQGAARSAGGDWQASRALSATGESAGNADVAIDPQGNAVAVWEREEGNDVVTQAAGYDATGPMLDQLSIPATGVTGQPVSFSVSPLDTWSMIGPTGWSFGDASTASGTSVSHVYKTPGSYEVTVTSTDALGNAASASSTIVITDQTPTETPGPTPKLSLSHVTMTHRSFRVSESSTAISASRARRAPLGTSFRFVLSARANLTIAITRQAFGRRRGKKCVAPAARLEHDHAGGCWRTITIAALTRSSQSPGLDSVAFSGRIGRHALPVGCYEARVTANRGREATKPVTLNFRIVH